MQNALPFLFAKRVFSALGPTAESRAPNFSLHLVLHEFKRLCALVKFELGTLVSVLGPRPVLSHAEIHKKKYLQNRFISISGFK